MFTVLPTSPFPPVEPLTVSESVSLGLPVVTAEEQGLRELWERLEGRMAGRCVHLARRNCLGLPWGEGQDLQGRKKPIKRPSWRLRVPGWGQSRA